MQVIFIHHSCFLVEIDEKVLIFDYFGGDKVEGFHFTGKLPDYSPETKIYMFASHFHKDHYDPEILKWTEKYPNIHYILSRDIRLSPGTLQREGIDPAVKERVTRAIPCKKYQVDDISIETLRSTDVGVAFYVETGGVSIYHAGDLADWYWDGIGELMNNRMTKNYRAEIRKIKDKPINLAFVPMDTRQKAYADRTIDFFLKNTDAEFVFPMHMWQDYSGIRRYKAKVSNLGMADRVMDIERENQVFLFGENHIQ